MHSRTNRSACKFWLPIAIALAALSLASPASVADWKFQVKFDRKVHAEAYTGRVYIAFSKQQEQPRLAPENWFRPESFIARDVKDWKPDEPLKFDAADEKGILAFPQPLSQMDFTGYRAQAVVRFNPLERNVGSGPGNGFSQVVELSSPEQPVPMFVVDQLVPAKSFEETSYVKRLRVRSELLSKFHQRDVYLEAAVILPASYATDAERRYPTIFIVPGFGGTPAQLAKTSYAAPKKESNTLGVEFIRVLLDPSCPLGHHVFADSANNGPYGQALIEELIPALDKEFRTVAEPTARFLTGHSSGGWSTLWLQVAYPDHFGGTWSTSPDPVDFRDFQQINLYRPNENMYVDPAGERRPLARRNGRVMLWYDDFAKMEWVEGYGGQLHSFEAVFSPRDEEGQPMLIWDRETGKIITEVARAWEPYDIRLMLERNWTALGPKLAGKLNIFMGDVDTFYLEGATKLLKASLAELGSDAVVEIHPNRDHSTLLSPDLLKRINQEMATAYKKRHPE